MAQIPTYDATDLAIVAQIRRNGRANNRQIAERLDLTATTVASRIRRMEAANHLRVVAVSDFAAHGIHVLVRIGVDVCGRFAGDVAADLAELPEVFAVHLVSGRHDIDMLVALHDFADLAGFLANDLARIAGIRALSPAFVVDILKYRFEVAPIEERSLARPPSPSTSGSSLLYPILDDLDCRLIETLLVDARISNRKIAMDLGVTEGTVRGRIRRLQQEGLITFTAITSYDMAECSQLVFIDIEADVENVGGIARQLEDIPCVNAVLLTIGQFNIIAICLVENLDALADVVLRRIQNIPGVRDTETTIAIRTLKYNAGISKITRADPPEDDEEDAED